MQRKREKRGWKYAKSESKKATKRVEEIYEIKVEMEKVKEIYEFEEKTEEDYEIEELKEDQPMKGMQIRENKIIKREERGKVEEKEEEREEQVVEEEGGKKYKTKQAIVVKW